MTNNKQNDCPEKIPLLHQAIIEGSLAKLNSLLENREIDLSEKYQGLTPLEASIGTRTEIVKALLTAGASVSNNPGQLLELLRRIWSDRENKKCSEILLELIKAGIDVNARLDEGETILMIAIRKSNLPVIKALIEAGADMNIVPENIIDNRGNFALFEAASMGEREIFEYLAQFVSTEEVLKEAKECLERGLIMQERFKDELTLRFMDSVLLGNLEMAVNAIKSGVDINAFSTEETTALWLAASIGNVSIVKLLIEVGVNLDLGREYDKQTPLMATIGNSILSETQDSVRKKRHLDIIKMLIQAGANVNLKTIEGWSALHLAASRNIEVVKVLVSAGANIHAKDKWGNTAVSEAQKAGRFEIVHFLQSEDCLRISGEYEFCQ